jgi:hypothetical protein
MVRRFRPDFSELLTVLANQRPSRPVLYEFAIGGHVLQGWTNVGRREGDTHLTVIRYLVDAYARGGYALGSANSVLDYVPLANYLAMRDAALSRRSHREASEPEQAHGRII